MIKTLGGQDIEVDVEGYLVNPDNWTGEIATEIAKELNIELSQVHWDMLNWLRERHYAGEEVNIRKVGKSGIVDIKQFYQLFPGGPLKNASKIAGLKKPTSCL
jgi:tRNA 2-thiouridine synthesizing protein E